jgi:hypothetical protein
MTRVPKCPSSKNLKSIPVSVSLSLSLSVSLCLSLSLPVSRLRESVLFIGTRFSNHYTAVDTPAEAAWYFLRLFRGSSTNDMEKFDGPSRSWPTPHTTPLFSRPRTLSPPHSHARARALSHPPLSLFLVRAHPPPSSPPSPPVTPFFTLGILATLL